MIPMPLSQAAVFTLAIINSRKYWQKIAILNIVLKWIFLSFILPSIIHDILFELVKQKIKCKNTLWLLEDIIRSSSGDIGIPIGNYLSQYLSNIYLNPLDHWIKEQLKHRYYFRYCDDTVILDSDKTRLHSSLSSIKSFLADYKLTLNCKTQIFPISARGIDFLGYKIFHNCAFLRKSSTKKFKQKIAYIQHNHKSLSSQHIVSSIMSYIGWLKHCDSHNLLKQYILNNKQLINILFLAKANKAIFNDL